MHIGAPPAVVFRTLVDVARWSEWTASVTSVERLDGGAFGLGSRARVRQPKLGASVWTVTEFVPDASFTWVASYPGLRTTAGHRLTAVDGGTLATLSITERGPFAPLVRLLLGGLTRRYVGMEAAGLKRRCERDSQETPS